MGRKKKDELPKGLKKCARCGEIKRISEFNMKKGKYDYYCIKCKKEMDSICASVERRRQNEHSEKMFLADTERYKCEKKHKEIRCAYCDSYPCFIGIETIWSNLALTCDKFKLKPKKTNENGTRNKKNNRV